MLTHFEDEIYSKTVGALQLSDNLGYKTLTIHLFDAMMQGSVSHAEALEALYFRDNYHCYPAWVSCRSSRYRHLL